MIGQILNERYNILSELGHGGMGTVYRAYDDTLNRDVAVKLMSNTRLGTEGRARLMGEAQTVAQLNHPNIVTVFDVGVVDSLPYIIMELAEGKTLRDQIPADWNEILAVAKQVTAALHHAHMHDVVHRDVKPENVAIAADGLAKLMDFGIAHSVSSRITTDGMVVGTVSYMSPEQAMGKSVDARSDLYSLGVMLYEFAAGELPFEDNDPIAVISQHINAPIVPARARREDIPPGLDALISHLLEKDPDDRPASAQAVLTALEDPLILEESAVAGKEISLLDRIVRGRIIGRSAEFQEARNLWSQASSGHGQLLLISGEPGVGKTRLTREIAAHAEVSGGRVLVGESFAEGNPPYGAFGQIVRNVLSPGALNGLEIPDFVLADLLTITPDMKQYYPDIPPNPRLEPEAERQRLFENVTTFFTRLSKQAPLLIVIDDAHWSNSGTLFLLRHLTRRTQELPVLLLATYREIELIRTHPLNEMLLEFNRQRIGARLKLSRLDPQTTHQLLESIFSEQVSEDFSQVIYHETEGNPFFIEEVCKSLVESGALYYQDGEWHRPDLDEIEIPQSVQVAIEARLENLPEEVIEVLRIAATLGREFDFNTLHRAGERSEDEVIDTLDVAERAQLLSELSGKSGGIFSFAHALIPTALISGLSGLRQRRLHQKALLAVEDLHPNDFSSLAHHAAESGEVEKTLEYAEKAGDAAAGLFAWEEAQFQYHRAIEAADDLDQNEHLSKLYESAGTAFVSQGLLLKAAEMFEKAAHQTELPDRKVELNSQVGTWYSFVGDKRGFPLLEEARRELNPKTQPLPLANTLMWIGRYHHMNGHHQQAIASLADAQKVADKLDDPLLQGRIYVNTAGAYQSLSQFEESDKLAQRAVDLGDDTNTPFLKAVGYEYFAENAYARGLWQASLDYAHQELEIASQIGDQNRLGWTQLCLTLGYFGLGKLSRSEQEALKGIALAEEIGDLRLRSLLKARYIEVIAQTGDYEEIEKYGRKAARQAEELGQIFMIGRINISRAINHLLHQEWQLALDLIGLIQKGLEGKDNRWIPQDADPVHAEALWGLGKLDEAAKLAETSYQFALETKAVHHQANLQRVLAQVAFSREEYAQALEHADLAIQAAASENYRLRWGRSLFWKAKILLTLEKSSEAKTAAQEALELVEFCGAQPDIDRTHNLLNTL